MNNAHMRPPPHPVTAPVIDIDLGTGVRAFFTTRAGGISTGGYDSLNLGAHVGDDPGAVAHNRDRVDAVAQMPAAAGSAAAAGPAPSRAAGAGQVRYSRQVHGTTVLDPATTAVPAPESAPIGDAWCTRSTIPVGVLVADCTPLLLADPGTGVIAAAHCGRGGLAAGIVQATVAAMSAAGSDPADIRAAIGPGICGDCYEVPAPLRADVDKLVPGVASTTSWDTPAIDIPAGVTAGLRSLGVEAIVNTNLCTLTDERFFSHRRAAGAPSGRSAGVIRLTD